MLPFILVRLKKKRHQQKLGAPSAAMQQDAVHPHHSCAVAQVIICIFRLIPTVVMVVMIIIILIIIEIISIITPFMGGALVLHLFPALFLFFFTLPCDV
jgi:hypothetical protein